MSATIERYVLVDRDDIEGDHEYESLDEAKAAAAKYRSAVIARSYVYDDSELIWTPDGGDIWPPSKRKFTRSK